MAEPNDFAGFLRTLEQRLEHIEANLNISPPNPVPNLDTYAKYIIDLEARVEKLEKGD